MVEIKSNHRNLSESLKEVIEEVVSGDIFKKLGLKGDPFVIMPRDPVGSFVNREAEMRKLFLSLRNLSQKTIPHIAILGWHGIGKTHFLYVASILAEGFKKELGYDEIKYIRGLEGFKKEFVELQTLDLSNSQIVKEAKNGKKFLLFIDDLDVIQERMPSQVSSLFGLFDGSIVGTWDARAWEVAKKALSNKIPKTESLLLKSLSFEHSQEMLNKRVATTVSKESIEKLFPEYALNRLAAIAEGNPYRLITYSKRYLDYIIEAQITEMTSDLFKEFCKEINIKFLEDIKEKINKLTIRQRDILRTIAEKVEISTDELSQISGIGRIAALKYLHLFKNMDLVESKPKNRTIYYYLPSEWVEDLCDYLDKLEVENDNKNVS